MKQDYNSKPTFTQIFLASSIGLIVVVAVHYRHRKIRDQKNIPRAKLSDSGRVEKLERFPHYVDRRECPHLCMLAAEYIRKSEGCEDNIYTYFAIEPDAESLFIKLVEEFERCIVSYFAFHWSQTDIMISQILSDC
ncbi:hypothetical protein L1049_004349 [Liquidambar formosana]|uniref:Uncharacterized protein n=1 Tax=Liquidambar formosana TaxID=63359 RepID=A0AAP0RSD3_LIQFO